MSPLTVRLKLILEARKAELKAGFPAKYPGLSEPDADRLAELIASARLQMIAEDALARLPEHEADAVLRRYEQGVAA